MSRIINFSNCKDAGDYWKNIIDEEEEADLVAKSNMIQTNAPSKSCLRCAYSEIVKTGSGKLCNCYCRKSKDYPYSEVSFYGCCNLFLEKEKK